MNTLIEVLTTGLAFAGALATLWYKLRAGRYKQRWRDALNLHDEASADAGPWEVRLKGNGASAKWVVTNGARSITVCDADLQYSWSRGNRATAEQLCTDLNNGAVKVAS